MMNMYPRHEGDKVQVLLGALRLILNLKKQELHSWIARVCDPAKNFCEELNNRIVKVRICVLVYNVLIHIF